MEVEQLIAEIARTTGLRLDKSDPILAAAIINDILLDRALVKLDRQVKVQADRVTAASTQAVEDAKREAELLVTEAGAWIEDRIKTAGEHAATKIFTQLDEETRKAKAARDRLLRAAWALGIAGLVAASAIAGIIMADFK